MIEENPQAAPSAASVVGEFWARIQARDWVGLAELLSPDVLLEYPASNETFRGPDSVVAVNAEYPEGWQIELMTLIAGDVEVATEVQVPFQDGPVFRAASFFVVLDGRIRRCREYWTTLGTERPPDWRRRFHA